MAPASWGANQRLLPAWPTHPTHISNPHPKPAKPRMYHRGSNVGLIEGKTFLANTIGLRMAVLRLLPSRNIAPPHSDSGSSAQ